MIGKILSGLLVAAALVAIPIILEPSFAKTAHMWILVAVAILASIFQPSYQVFEVQKSTEDRGTAAQIVWSVYVTEFFALIEAVKLRYPLSVQFDEFAVIGLILMIAGLVLRSLAYLILGKFFTWHVRTQEGQSIVEKGPYRLIRHPSYTGAFLIYFFMPMFLHSWFAMVLAVLTLPIAFARRIRQEESHLSKSIPGYRDYIKKTWAVIPYVL